MSALLTEIQNHIQIITLNRPEKHNAFDDHLLVELKETLLSAQGNPDIKVILLRANGKNFSAGADLAWMKRMTEYSEEDNIKDAQILADVMHLLHSNPKPTLAVVQGAAYGGGAGLAAACDIAIASETAQFCFSEVKLGLIPAVISPYVVEAIGARLACSLFITADRIDAQRAYEIQLVHHIQTEDKLLEFSIDIATRISKLAPQAVKESKALVQFVKNRQINEALIEKTAHLIAKKRISEEGQKGLKAFLNKESIHWS